MITVSSLPLASHLPEKAQRTHSTEPVCEFKVQSDLGGLFDSSDAALKIGRVDQMRTLESMPPVAMRDPSGCT
jgi:hypothetical protein